MLTAKARDRRRETPGRLDIGDEAPVRTEAHHPPVAPPRNPDIAHPIHRETIKAPLDLRAWFERFRRRLELALVRELA
jgi:hypothetical protein